MGYGNFLHTPISFSCLSKTIHSNSQNICFHRYQKEVKNLAFYKKWEYSPSSSWGQGEKREYWWNPEKDLGWDNGTCKIRQKNEVKEIVMGHVADWILRELQKDHFAWGTILELNVGTWSWRIIDFHRLFGAYKWIWAASGFVCLKSSRGSAWSLSVFWCIWTVCCFVWLEILIEFFTFFFLVFCVCGCGPLRDNYQV